ncbi:MAG: hypothetical protein IPM46_03925 [Flavobacteriales bacterium]|nr:hypothetical protein [Flavobacteriales bacterium]
MRTMTTLVAGGIALGSFAQVLMNPSFEVGPNGSLSYWEHDCMAQSVLGGAPSSGAWCAEVEASNPQGCFWSGLYQPIGGFDGMTFALGGWCRNVAGPWTPAIGFDIGIMDLSGTITPMGLGPTTTDTVWTWLGMNDTLHLAADEQAVVVCNPGVVGGPAFASARFDGIQFFKTFPFSIDEVPRLSSHLDIAGGYISVACMNARIVQARLLDALGREIASVSPLGDTTTARLLITARSPGVYFVAVRTDLGDSVVRFALP